MASRRIPVILLTGFLGSGKTTLLNAILRAPEMSGTAVLINEVGAVGLDHLLVEEVAEDVSLLASGCLCCAMRGDLVRSLRDLFMRRLRREIPALDRVVIETTGLADPAPVIHTLLGDFFLAERFVLEGVISTLDVRNAPWQLAQHQEAIRQIVMADRVVLTKCDLADSLVIAEAEERVAGLHPGVTCLPSEPGSIPEGLLADLRVFDAEKSPDVVRWLGEAEAREQQRLKARLSVFGSAGAEPSVHDERIVTHVLRFEEPVVWGEFTRAMDTLQSVLGEHILRIKGLVCVQGEACPRVIHAVQHERYPDTRLPQWPDADHASRLVFIVDGLSLGVLEKAFQSFCGLVPSASL